MKETPIDISHSEVAEWGVETQPTMDDFRGVVTGIEDSYAYGRNVKKDKWSKIRTETRQSFVDDEVNPELRALAEIVMMAPAAASLDRQFEEHKLKLEDKSLSDEERAREKDISARVKKPLVGYNHRLRDFIADNIDSLEKEEFTEMLGRAGKDETWSRKLVTGIAAEVALTEYLSRLPEVSSVKTATNGEDSLGIDLVARMEDGRRVPLDVKSGNSQPRGGVEPGRYSVKLGVPSEAIGQWRIIPEYDGLIRDRLQQAAALSK